MDWKEYPPGIDLVNPFTFGVNIYPKKNKNLLFYDKLVIEFSKKHELFLDKRDIENWAFYKNLFSVIFTTTTPIELKSQLVCFKPDLVKATLRKYDLLEKACFKPIQIDKIK